MKITKQQQRDNRFHLADMIEHRVTDKQFNMGEHTNECGTVGCALGIAALSNEFDGLGWNREGEHDPLPVIEGRFVYWSRAARLLFGHNSTRVFYGLSHLEGIGARKKVADALRAVND